MTPLDFVYPWLSQGSGTVWDIIYSMRSIDAALLTGDYRVTIVGDRPPTLGSKEVPLMHMALPPTPPMRFRRCTDVSAKMEWIANCPLWDRFVYMYDDQFFLQPITAEYLAQRIALAELLPGNVEQGRAHLALKARTYKALRESGLDGPLWDFETHMPRLFESRKMREVLERFNPGKNHLLFCTLYYNWHWRTEQNTVVAPEVLNKLDHHKAGFYGFEGPTSFGNPSINADPEAARQHYFRAMKGKHVLNFNDAARTLPLLDVIKFILPNPGPYETAATAHRLNAKLYADGTFKQAQQPA